MSTPSALPPLASVTQLSKYVTRILGQNPGKFTLQGTNTYLVHHPTSPSLILLDTAQGFPSYLSNLRTAVSSHPVQPCFLTDIVLSHYHHDHTEGLPSVVAELDRLGVIPSRGVRVWKFPCDRDVNDGAEVEEDARVEARLNDSGIFVERERRRGESCLIDSPLRGGRDDEAAIVKGGKIRALTDRQRFVIEGETGSGSGSGRERVELRVVHTPGHTSDSISISLHVDDDVEPSSSSSSLSSSSSSLPSPIALFSFDTVLGHGTAVFSSLSAYLESLTSLISLVKGPARASNPSPRASRDDNDDVVPIYPGHGAVIVDGLAKLKEYREHRLERERQVVQALKALRRPTGGDRVTASLLTESIYGDSIPSSLKLAATRGLLLHLDKLEQDGVVSRERRRAPGEDEEEQVTTTMTGVVDWASLGIAEKDVPKGWDDTWSWNGNAEEEA